MKLTKIFLPLILMAGIITGCNSNPAAEKTTVVYGSIYTGETAEPIEAFVVRGGKYIYTGARAGAEKYIDSNTEIIDRTRNGMIVPAFSEGHSHYLMAETNTALGGIVLTINSTPEDFYSALETEYAKAKAEGRKAIIGFGWLYQAFDALGMPTIEEIDKRCPDIPLYVADGEVHKGLCNTCILMKAGILDESGKLKDERQDQIRGGEIYIKNGKPTGLVTEQAGNYIRAKGIDYSSLLTEQKLNDIFAKVKELLYKNGYTSYLDGWSNYYFGDMFYRTAKKLDASGNLNLVLGMSYEIESWQKEELDSEIIKAVDLKRQYSTLHVKPNWAKFFVDGTVETGTGLLSEPYKFPGNPSYGSENWTQDELNYITQKVNGNNLSMHVHAMGDAAVERCINAFSSSQIKYKRNTIVHLRNVKSTDFARLAANDIICTVGMLWHCNAKELVPYYIEYLPDSIAKTSYPIKSHFNAGVTVTSSCDYPALSGSPDNPFGIMRIAVTGKLPDDNKYDTDPAWDTGECITREEMLKALTINGAYQFGMENERGSIMVGKYADFVFADKDVFAKNGTEYVVPDKDINKTQVTATYFEGKKVY